MARIGTRRLRTCFDELTAADAREIVAALNEAEGGRFVDVSSAFAALEGVLQAHGEYAYFGTEVLWSTEDWDQIVGEYLNTGDMYSCTLCYDHVEGKFYLMDYEAFAEMLNRKHGELHQ